MENQTNARIDFDINWNGKLLCNAFTTIRHKNDEKYKFGNVYEIALNNNVSGPAQIVLMRDIKLSEITTAMAYVDTGFSADEARTIIKNCYPKLENIENETFTYIVLKRTIQDVNLSNQNKELSAI